MNRTRKKTFPWLPAVSGPFRLVGVVTPFLAVSTLTGFAQDLDVLPPSLKELPAMAKAHGVPLEPPTLADYVKDREAAILLGKALAGQHIHKTHEVRITGHLGKGVKTTSLEKAKPARTKKVIPTEALSCPSSPKC